MKKLLFVFVALILVSCNQRETQSYTLVEKIPQKAEFIISSSHFSDFQTKLQQNQFLSESNFGLKRELTERLQALQYIESSSEVILSLWIEKNDWNFIFATKADSSLIPLEDIKDKKVETKKENGFSYQEYQLNKNTFYLYRDGNSNFISNSVKNLKNLLQDSQILKDQQFAKAYQAADRSKTSILIKNQSLSPEIDDFFENFSFSDRKELGKWMVLDLEIKGNSLAINGISIHNGNTFLNRLPARNLESTKLIPVQFISYYSFGLDQQLLSNKDSIQQIPEILSITKEVSTIEIPSGRALILNGMEAEAAKEKMAGKGDQTEIYRDIPIFRITNQDLLKKQLSRYIQLEPPKFYAILDHFVLFSEKEEVIKDFIIAQQSSALLSEKTYFTEFSQALSSQSSLLFLTNLQALKGKNSGQENSSFPFKKNSIAALQFINENGYSHIHGMLSTGSENIKTEGTSQTLAVQTGGALAIRPYFFKNHLTDQMDIAVQDEANMLYLFSNRGNLHWKKQLDSRINGNIFQVDLFRNGYQQLAFTTGFQLNVLDRNGNTVKPFPVKFSDQLTQPLAVFDYDSNRKYRFVMVQNRNMYMVGPRGKAIKGFDFEKAGDEIIQAPKHIRLGTKDYILIAEKSGKLSILNRQGHVRIPVKEKINFSENEWYGYNDHFISSAPSENLIEIDQKGNILEKPADLAENNKLVANDDDLVYLSENILHINDEEVELDYGLYTEPQLFSIEGKTLVAITDTQTRQVFVFNNDGKLLEGFPVFGNSQVDIANADTDKNLELLVQGDDNEVIVYDF